MVSICEELRVYSVDRQILMHTELNVLWRSYGAGVSLKAMTASEQSSLSRHASNLLGKSDSTLVPLSGEVTRVFQVGAYGINKPYQMGRRGERH